MERKKRLKDTAPKETLPDVETHSEGFRANREARRNVLVEDYVELISDLLSEGQEARQVDIAGRLGVSQPTVAKMLARLATEGYVTQKPYRGVFLTPAGQEMADKARHRHRIVEAFLLALGVSEENARVDSEGVEHYVGSETLTLFEKAIRGNLKQFMQNLPDA